jgi:hypothetical protein
VLEHWHFDTFRVRWMGASLMGPGLAFVQFRLNAAGKADELVMDMGGQPVAFKRRPEPPAQRAATGADR